MNSAQQTPAQLIDFLAASLDRHGGDGRFSLSPREQKAADALSRAVDGQLHEMVSALEDVASCQQPNPAPAHEDLPPLESFCAGMRHIGEQLLPLLFDRFEAAAADEGVRPGALAWIVRSRAEAYVGYLMQLARVHGLAFDGERLQKRDTPPTVREQGVLLDLERALNAICDDRLRRLDQL
ncbi:hypothetical protein [Yunchengibacter salinarum]|uniref:hypothetical protein n=1 Tax=Yunchengibacter salinarum TaxID=3133399 RepID=UPI0035B64FE3